MTRSTNYFIQKNEYKISTPGSRTSQAKKLNTDRGQAPEAAAKVVGRGSKPGSREMMYKDIEKIINLSTIEKGSEYNDQNLGSIFTKDRQFETIDR